MTRLIRLSLLAAFAALAFVPSRSPAATPSAPAIIFDVDPIVTTGPIVSRQLYGINVARWDHGLYPAASTPGAQEAGFPYRNGKLIRLLADLRPAFLKYPGGNDADSYLWDSPGNPPGDLDTTEVIDLAKRVIPALEERTGRLFFTVNFTQSPELAARWVEATCGRWPPRGNYFGRPYTPNVFAWEVGDEVWGDWTAGHLPGDAYGRRFREFATAMKKVNSNIRVAANLGLAQAGSTWTREAIRSLGDSYDIVTFTFFPLNPPNETDEALIRTPDAYRRMFGELKSAVDAATARAGRKKPVQYCLVGFNSVSTRPGPQTISMANAVFMAQMYGALAETGTDMACWWAWRNVWAPRGGDYGLVAGKGLPGLEQDTPHYTYWVFRALSRNFFGRLVAVRREGGLELYAVTPKWGEQQVRPSTLLAINTSDEPTTAIRVRLHGRLAEEALQSTPDAEQIDARIDRTLGPRRLKLKAEAAGNNDDKEPGAPPSAWIELGPLPPQSVTVVRMASDPDPK